METKRKEKGKAIIGIALAAIMVASVMVAMVTPVAAQWVRTPRPVIDVGSTYIANPVVVQGEVITLTSGAAILKEIIAVDPVGPTYTYGATITRDPVTLAFDTVGKPTAVYHSNLNTFVTVAALTFSQRLQVGTAAVSSCAAGSRIDVVVSSNIPGALYTLPPLAALTGGPNDLKLTIIDPDTGTETNAGVSPGIVSRALDAFADVDGNGIDPGDIRVPAWVVSIAGDTFVDVQPNGVIDAGDTWESAGAGPGLPSIIPYLLNDVDYGGTTTAVDVVITANWVASAVGDTFVDQDGSGTITPGDTWEALAAAPGPGLVSTIAYLLDDVDTSITTTAVDVVITAVAPVVGGPFTLYDVDNNGVDAGDVVTPAGIPAGTAWTVTTGTGGLSPGDYTFTVGTYTTGFAQAAIDTKTTTKDMTVEVSAITVEVDPTEQTTGNDILITTRAGATTRVRVTITGAGATFDVNQGDYPGRAICTVVSPVCPVVLSTAKIFVATIPADGTLEAVMSSPITGAVTVTATIPATGATDTVTATFTKADTDVEVSARRITIGDKVTISGTTTSGVDQVAIFIDDILHKVCPIKADDTYEWEWDTGVGVPPKPGSVTIKVFEIHPSRGDIVGGIPSTLSTQSGGTGTAGVNIFFDTVGNVRPADASTGLSAVAGDLYATMDVPRVAKEDDIVIYGTAEGEAEVRVILIESDGTVRRDLTESVQEDGTYEFTTPTGTSWRSGTYKAMIITDGRDGTTLLTCSRDITGTTPNIVVNCGAIGDDVAGNADSNTLLHVTAATIGGTLVRSMTQNQLVETLDSYILPEAGAAGSDDKRIVLSFKLEDPDVEITEIENVIIEIDQLSVDVTVTDGALTVKGITNRLSDTLLMITAESTVDPKYDLTPMPVYVANGTFTANLDVPEGVTGTYTVTVEDLSQATDELTVEILAEPTATPTPEPEPTAEPTEAPAVPTPEPTAEPTPTPEPPGFEAVFAIAGLLSIAYLVLRKRK